MSNQLFDQTRRRFLKGAAYVSALSATGLTATGLTGVAFANKKQTITADAIIDEKILGDRDIKIIQETLNDREKVTLINQSGKLQMLDARQPISLHQINGALVVTVNQNDAKATNGMVLMSPNERFTFDVKAIGIEVAETHNIPTLTNLAENQLQIVSEHSVFNRIVPVALA